eukprot:Mrub_06514.p1 GENE.Mrub_06514~~Mrub_06514.p1  ORF type:complete len:320 (-),score=27.00 Mrub_06514:44-1003(-)
MYTVKIEHLYSKLTKSRKFCRFISKMHWYSSIPDHSNFISLYDIAALYDIKDNVNVTKNANNQYLNQHYINMSEEIVEIVKSIEDIEFQNELISNLTIIDNVTGDHRIDHLPYLLTRYKVLMYTGHGNAVDYLKAYNNDFLFWNYFKYNKFSVCSPVRFQNNQNTPYNINGNAIKSTKDLPNNKQNVILYEGISDPKLCQTGLYTSSIVLNGCTSAYIANTGYYYPEFISDQYITRGVPSIIGHSFDVLHKDSYKIMFNFWKSICEEINSNLNSDIPNENKYIDVYQLMIDSCYGEKNIKCEFIQSGILLVGRPMKIYY